MTTLAQEIRFNPCFNGSVERGVLRSTMPMPTTCFNPCFNGSVERGRVGPIPFVDLDRVSILVLMEVLREANPPRRGGEKYSRFNPCFNGSVERG